MACEARDEAIALIPAVPLGLGAASRGALARIPDLVRALAASHTGVNIAPARLAQDAAALARDLRAAEYLISTANDSRVARLLGAMAAHIETCGITTTTPEIDAQSATTLVAVVKALVSSQEGKSAWRSNPDEIAQTVWRQIKLGLDAEQAATLNDPAWYHIDDGVKFGEPEGGGPIQVQWNDSPFQINPASEFDRRPGKGLEMPTQIKDPNSPTTDGTKPIFYEIANEQWVVAGMFTKTYTRLATMEMSVEAGRHAANAILDHEQRRSGKNMGDFCKIENPEDHEVEDLAFLKRIDEQLLAEGLPHFLDILGVQDAVIFLKGLRERGRFSENPLDRALQLLRASVRSGRSELSTLEAILPMPIMPSLSVRDSLSDFVDKAAALLQTAIKQLPDIGRGGR
jgi:hypothetical protein